MMLEQFIEELTSAVTTSFNQDIPTRKSFELLAMAGIAGIPDVIHTDYSVSTRGMITIGYKFEAGQKTLGTISYNMDHATITTKQDTYIVRPDFDVRKPITSYEVKLTKKETEECVLFFHLGGGMYETLKNGKITCKISKYNTFETKAGSTFALSNQNEICNSSCAATGNNYKQIKIVLDPLPAPHPTLVRMNEEKIDIPIGTGAGARGSARRMQAILDKTIRESERMLADFNQPETVLQQTNHYAGIVAVCLVLAMMVAISAYCGTRWYRKKKYAPVAATRSTLVHTGSGQDI